MRSPRATSFARLCAFNAGIQLVWGAILGVSLQARTIALSSPGDAVARYSVLAAVGAVAATIVQLIAGRAADRVRARGESRGTFYAVGTSLAVLAIVGFFSAPSFALFALAFVALQVSINVASGPYQAIIPDYVAIARRGAASAWMSAYQSIGNAAGLLVAGLASDLRVVAGALALPFFTSYVVSARYAASLPFLDATPVLRESATARRGVLGALMLSRGLANVGFFVLLDYLLFFVRDSLHVAPARVQMTTAFVFLTFTLCAIVGAIVAARPTDRGDKRLVVTLALATIVVALAGLATTISLAAAFGFAGVAGAAWGAFVTADWALATAVLPARAMATAMGVWNVATTVPQVLAPLVAGPLVVYANVSVAGAGPRVAIAASIVAFALGAGTIWRLPRV